jgi:hypothetical protein
MARRPRGECASCERRAVLVDQILCRTCSDFENEMQRNAEYHGLLLEMAHERFRAWLKAHLAEYVASYQHDPEELAEAAWLAAWNQAPAAAREATERLREVD